MTKRKVNLELETLPEDDVRCITVNLIHGLDFNTEVEKETPLKKCKQYEHDYIIANGTPLQNFHMETKARSVHAIYMEIKASEVEIKKVEPPKDIYNKNNPILELNPDGNCRDPGERWLSLIEKETIKARIMRDRYTSNPPSFVRECSPNDYFKLRGFIHEMMEHHKRILEELGEVEVDERTVNTEFTVIN